MNHLSNSAAAEQGAIQAALIGAIAEWCEGLHGQAPLVQGVASLAEALGAEVIAVSRTPRREGGRAKWLAHDAGAGSGRLSVRSHASALLGAYLATARPGSVWFGSMFDAGADPILAEFQARRRLSEIVVIPLDVTARHVDAVEIHLADKPAGHLTAALNMLGETLTRTWQNRAPGQFTEALLRVEARAEMLRPGLPLLSVENPARLSRAEFRVCLLLSRGRAAGEVQGELGITDSTLRSHLRNIYAKTGTRNLSGLVYHLVSAIPFSDACAEVA